MQTHPFELIDPIICMSGIVTRLFNISPKVLVQCRAWSFSWLQLRYVVVVNRALSLKLPVIKKAIIGIIFSCWHLGCLSCQMKDLTMPSLQLRVLRLSAVFLFSLFCSLVYKCLLSQQSCNELAWDVECCQFAEADGLQCVFCRYVIIDLKF